MSAPGREGFRLLHLDASSARALAQLEIPLDSPLFAGHFPGQPVLPGIAHLALVQHVLAERTGKIAGLASESAIVEVRHLRLRRLVEPRDRLALSIEAAGDGRFRFQLRRPAEDGELVSQGTVRCGPVELPESPGSQEVPRPAGEPPGTPAAFPPAAELLPQAAPALLLSAVLSASAAGIACDAIIPTDHPLAADGGIPGFAALELGAQAAAALQALLRHGGHPGSPRIGYLVGVRDAFFLPTLTTGLRLRVTAIPAGNAAPLAIYEMEVWAGEAAGGRLAAGTLSTFLVDTALPDGQPDDRVD